MIKDYYIIQVLDGSGCTGFLGIREKEELIFSRVIDLNGSENFDDDWDEDEDEYIYEPSISFRHPTTGWNDIRKNETSSYNLIKSQVEYYKNGNIKKCIIKGGRKVRLLSPVKARKNVRKRIKRMVRG